MSGSVHGDRRSSGILLHPTSLPGRFGSGELGREAARWIAWLADAGQRSWQVMPLGPTGFGDSPYQCFSAFAGNPYLVSLETLHHEGWLSDDDLAPGDELPTDHVDFGRTLAFRSAMLARAARRFDEQCSHEERASLDRFVDRHRAWLDDFATFMALKEEHHGRPWNEWPTDVRDRHPDALALVRVRLASSIRRHQIVQWWFHAQWAKVRSLARAHDVEIVGDLPIFVAYDSADVWAHRELFHLDDTGSPTVVAGVPPDYFSPTGQRWGNPLYRWDAARSELQAWWSRRIEAAFELADLVRIDHFRGFAAYWEIPADEPTAVRGRWVEGPGQALFDAMRETLGPLRIVAEDLGVITPDVDALREANGFPGMRVLQFAFAGGPQDPYLPHNYDRNTVVYTGTHDNDTTRGWYRTAPEEERDLVRRYCATSSEDVTWSLIRVAAASVADLCIVPLQDALDLGSEARMNVPGRAEANWSWRFQWEEIPGWLAPELRAISHLYGRLAPRPVTSTAYRTTDL